MPDYNLGTARGRIEIDGSGVNKGVDEATRGIGRLKGSNEAVAGSLVRTGTVMAGVGAAAVAGFGVAVNAAANFEKGISAIGAVSGATDAQLDVLRKKALQLGADTKFSAGEAAGAMEELVKAGLSVDDVLNGAADAVVNLAAAGEVDLKTAATIAANAMNQFHLAAKDMPKVADLISGAANASAIDVSDFGLSLQQAGATANLTGLSFDDLSVAIAAMGNAGIRGSDAGTSLKTFLQNLQPVTEKETELMAKLGLITVKGGGSAKEYATAIKQQRAAQEQLATSKQKLLELQERQNAAGAPKSELERVTRAQQLAKATDAVTAAQTKLDASNSVIKKGVGQVSNAFFDANGKVKSMSEIAGVLSNSLKGMNEQQKAAALQTIFGSDAIRAAAIISNTGAEGFDKLAASMGKVSAADVAKKRMDNLAGSIEQFKGSVETALIAAGAPFQNVIRGIVDGATKLVNNFAALDKGTQALIIQIVLAAGALTGIVGVFIATVGFAMKFVNAMKQIKEAFNIIKETKAVVNSLKLLNSSFLGMPVFWVIAGLVALGVALYMLYQRSETFRRIVDQLWQTVQVAFDKIREAVSDTVEFIQRNWATIIAVLLVVMGPIGWVIAAFIKFRHGIMEAVGDVVEFIVRNWKTIGVILLIAQGPIGILVALFLKFRKQIMGAVGDVIDFIGRNWKTIGKILLVALGPIGLVIAGFIKFKDKILGAVGAVASGVGGVVKGIAGGISSLFGDSHKKSEEEVAKFKDLATKAQESIEKSFEAASAAMNRAFTSGGKISEQESKNIIGHVENMRDKTISTINDMADKRIARIKDLRDNTATIGKEEADTIIANINRSRDESIKSEQQRSDQVSARIIELKNKGINVTAEMVNMMISDFGKLRDESIRLTTESKTKQEALLASLGENTGRISKEQKEKIIKDAREKRDETIKAAHEETEARINEAYRAWQAHDITKLQFDQIVAEARYGETETVKSARGIARDTIAAAGDLERDLPPKAERAFGGMVSAAQKAKGETRKGGAFDWGDVASTIWNTFKNALFGSPHTKIEYTMWDMVDNVGDSIKDLRRQVRQIQSIHGTLNSDANTNFQLSNTTTQAVLLRNAAMAAQGANTTTVGGDHFEFHEVKTTSREIAEDIMWEKRLRSR